MSHTPPDFFDTDGLPESAATPSSVAERKLKVWAVLNAVEQGQLTVAEAYTAFGINAAEMEEHRAGWLEFETGGR